MITAFTVKNFKAIGDDKVKIELKPITLLFGTNSAGKSSILHALQYAHEVFNNRNIDANKMMPGKNNSLDLGGFRRFIHQGELNRSIVLRFELKFNVEMIPNDFVEHNYRIPTDGGMEDVYQSADMLNPKKLLSGKTKPATKAYVEVKISWDDTEQRPYVSRYETGINDEEIATIINANNCDKEIAIRYLNTAHPVFSDFWIEYGVTLDCLIEKCVKPEFYEKKLTDQEKIDVQSSPLKTPEIRMDKFKILGQVPSTAFSLSSNNNINIGLRHQSEALPSTSWDSLFLSRVWADPNDYDYDDVLIERHGKLRLPAAALSIALEDLLRCLLVAPGRVVAEWLKSVRYLGPLREIPPRNFISDLKKVDRSRWATGLAAWDIFNWIGQQQLNQSVKSSEATSEQTKNHRNYTDNLLNNINNWLLNDHRLNTGYEIFIEFYREIPSKIFNNQPQKNTAEIINEILSEPEKFRIWLQDKSRKNLNLTPHDIGTGISQVLPVVVAAIVEGTQLVAIEQPELHIHPAMQVRLGDLFIEQSNDQKFFLIETHSEHLVLRLMRRIREGKINPDDINVVFVEPLNHGGRFIKLRLDEEGDFIDEWPGGFFEESFHEKFAGR